jgi:hypothetical protein
MNDIEEIVENHHHQDRNIETREKGTNDTTMTDNKQPTTRNQQQETTISRNTASTTAGDFTQQFNIRPNNKTGVNRQERPLKKKYWNKSYKRINKNSERHYTNHLHRRAYKNHEYNY